MINNIVFDFGNVLASVDRLEACTRIAAHCPYNGQEVLERIYNNEIERSAETGVFDSHAHFAAVRDRIEADADWTYEQFVEEYQAGFTLIEEGIAALRRVSVLAKRVFILSNTSYLHSLWLFGQEELATLPEWHVFSYKVGVMKPDRAIWQHLIDCAGIRAAESLYIDDIPAYCDAARSLGFSVINYRAGSTDLAAEIDRLL
jgi:FMN phosphatase YigB (HAD superfamily)